MANLPFSNIFYRKTRTGIGILSVAIEVALVVVVIGLVHGTLDENAKRIENIGADFIFQGPDSSPFLSLNTGVMPVQLAEKLEEVPGIQSAAPVLYGKVTDIKGQSKFVAILGGGRAVFEAVRTTRVFGNIAADSTARLARRVRSEVEPMDC